MEVSELLRQYASGKRDFGFANLQGVTLTGMDLTNIALYQANLVSAVLVQVNFTKANLRQANLQGADLSQANLRWANLRRANLKDAILEGAILDGAILTGAILPDGTPHSPVQDAELQSSDSSDSLKQAISHSPMAVSPLSQVSEISPLAEELSSPQFQQIPWASLCFWWLGFSLFGLLLALCDAGILNWLVAWFSSICWILGESLTWFVPIIAAIAVFDAAGISVVTLGTVVLIVLTLFITLKVVLGWSFRETLKGSLWVGGIAAILVQLASWLFYGADAYSGGGIVVSLDTLHLAIILILAIVFSSLGTIAWLQMLKEKFSQKTIFGIVSLTAAIGLLCGGMMSFL
jgi:uncharacterized protein YjbI with pentapeptide repeats